MKWPAPTGPTWANPPSAVRAAQERAQPIDVVGIAAGHDAEALAQAPDAAGHARVDEVDAALGEHRRPPHRVGVAGIAAIDDQVAGLEARGQLGDLVLGRVAGREHEPDRARRRQQGDDLVDRERRHGALGGDGEDLVGRPVVGDDRVPGTDQAAGHATAHPAEPDHRQGGSVGRHRRCGRCVGRHRCVHRRSPRVMAAVSWRTVAGVDLALRRSPVKRFAKPRHGWPWTIDDADRAATPFSASISAARASRAHRSTRRRVSSPGSGCASRRRSRRHRPRSRRSWPRSPRRTRAGARSGSPSRPSCAAGSWPAPRTSTSAGSAPTPWPCWRHDSVARSSCSTTPTPRGSPR